MSGELGKCSNIGGATTKLSCNLYEGTCVCFIYDENKVVVDCDYFHSLLQLTGDEYAMESESQMSGFMYYTICKCVRGTRKSQNYILYLQDLYHLYLMLKSEILNIDPVYGIKAHG